MIKFDLVVLQDDVADGRLKADDVETILTVYSEGKAFESDCRCGRICQINGRSSNG